MFYQLKQVVKRRGLSHEKGKLGVHRASLLVPENRHGVMS